MIYVQMKASLCQLQLYCRRTSLTNGKSSVLKIPKSKIINPSHPLDLEIWTVFPKNSFMYTCSSPNCSFCFAMSLLSMRVVFGVLWIKCIFEFRKTSSIAQHGKRPYNRILTVSILILLVEISTYIFNNSLNVYL